MKLLPNAKINIGLQVGNTLPNGYHRIETVFYPIGLHDEIDIEPTDGPLEFSSDGITIDCSTEQNLIVRTFRTMQEQFGFGNVSIHLSKHIPFGAGLGGGSSDAAFTAYALNLLYGLNLSPKQLADIVGHLGSDCSFFIYNQPMFAQGIGTDLSPVELSLEGYYLALVKPNINIPTAAAYRSVPCSQLVGSPVPTLFLPVEQWKDKIHNDFEYSIFPLYPSIQQIKDRLYENGAVYASMTGTGAAVYGLFKQVPNLQNIFADTFLHIEKL